ncbi:MAG: ribonuclease HII [Elusimicrobiota bacterium]
MRERRSKQSSKCGQLELFDRKIRREKGFRRLIGVDEAGRGPLAGPVVVAAVLLPASGLKDLKQVRDSKLLSARAREKLFPLIQSKALAISVAWAHPEEIDRHNILQATLRAMRSAVFRIGTGKALAVVDGNRLIPGLAREQLVVVKGDRLSLCVACASIIAKVVRDKWMEHLERRYPGYGFARHKGYGTRDHLAAISRLGPSPAHRFSFAPLASAR